jgi:hypothetical protein
MLLCTKHGKKAKEVGVVMWSLPQSLNPEVRGGLKEEDDFGDHSGQPPNGLRGTSAQVEDYTRFAAYQPLVASALIDLNIEIRASKSSVDMGGKVEGAAVPLLDAVRREAIVGVELPAGKVSEQCIQLVLEDSDVNVIVIASLAPEPGVNGPAATKGPAATESRHEVRDPGERLRNGDWDRRQEMLLGFARYSHVPNVVWRAIQTTVGPGARTRCRAEGLAL